MLNSDVLDKKLSEKDSPQQFWQYCCRCSSAGISFCRNCFGTGPALGQSFLPMHLPILIAALIAGPVVGIIAGLFSPLISFALTGNAGFSNASVYDGRTFGIWFCGRRFKGRKTSGYFESIIAQFFGRGVRAAAILASFYIFNIQAVSSSVILSSIVQGLPGLILQWSIIPLFIFWYNKRGENE